MLDKLDQFDILKVYFIRLQRYRENLSLWQELCKDSVDLISKELNVRFTEKPLFEPK